ILQPEIIPAMGQGDQRQKFSQTDANRRLRLFIADGIIRRLIDAKLSGHRVLPDGQFPSSSIGWLALQPWTNPFGRTKLSLENTLPHGKLYLDHHLVLSKMDGGAGLSLFPTFPTSLSGGEAPAEPR